jgi:molybdate transport system regulatory protein
VTTALKTNARTSTSNCLRGVVSRILSGSVMTEVRVDVNGSEFVAAVTRHGVEQLDLATGDRVGVLVRATELTLAKGSGRIDNLTTRNQIEGKVTSIVDGSVLCEVRVDADGDELVSVVTRYSIERLRLAPGDDVVVLVKATDVSLVVTE